MMTTAILGLGEAGSLYAAGFLDCGFTVHGYDPFVSGTPEGIRRFDSLEDAVSSADLVISLVGASVSKKVADEALPLVPEGAVFADFNTGSPQVKKAVADRASEFGVLFADVAVLAPVPRAGVLTPLTVSGTGASAFTSVMEPTGTEIDCIHGAAGDAASRKLLRSVFMKGLAAVVLESVTAAEAAGQATWLRDQIVAELDGAGDELIERLVTGSRKHAIRRAHETSDAAAYLDDLNVPNWSTAAANAWLSSLADS
ncbi:NAD(P)-dependent oxidoreductase [Brevibacterium sp. UCMA 11754]|nr:NAD(P)-dependent oxidoreductase [Brevibacterium sp. UCMA 11754]